MRSILFAIFTTALIDGISCGWRDVVEPRSLSVSGVPPGALAAGAPLELLCNASGLQPYTTLRWTSQQGNVQLSSWARGSSPLPLPLRAEPALHNAKFFCSAPFTEAVEGRYFTYSVLSEPATLTLVGAPQPQPPYRPGHIEMEAPAGTTHRVGDLVSFICTVHDMPYAVVDVVQAKGNYEMQLHSGLQPRREVRVAVSAADRGSALYCRATAPDPDDYRESYTLVSNRVPIYIAA